MDSGTAVGYLEMRRSLRPVVLRTFAFLVLGILVGSGGFVVLRVYPMRALRRAGESLAREKEQAQATLQSIGDGVIATDAEGRIVLLNPAAERMTGWTSGEASGSPVEEVFRLREDPLHNPSSSGFGPPDRDAKMGKLLVSRHGTERAVEETVTEILDAGGNASGKVIAFRDVTEKVRAEEELVKVRKLESLGILAGGIAHDFNNFLAAILGNISLAMAETGAEDPLMKRLEEAERASIRAKELASKLLTFSKGGRPVRKVFSAEGVIREAALFSARGSSARVEFDFPEGLWTVNADEVQISEVVNNLVINAVQAMPSGGIVRIKGRNVAVGPREIAHVAAGNYIRIDVADTGVGIPRENLPLIFDPYFSTKKKGSGLGLTTCYNILKSHGGNIFVSSTPGEGTVFNVYLPAGAAKTEEEPARAVEAQRGKGRILVMDDDEMVREVAGGMLRHLGYEAVFAEDGEEAVALYARGVREGRKFDAVITDLTVPGGMGGKETVRRLLEIDPGARVIVSSGYSTDPIMANFREHGFIGVMAKPYRLEEMAIAVRSVLDGGPSLRKQ